MPSTNKTISAQKYIDEKPSVTRELEILLLAKIAKQKDHRAITDEIRPNGIKWNKFAWRKTVEFALIRMVEKGWLRCPFGVGKLTDRHTRREWLLSHKRINTNVQVWEITTEGLEYFRNYEFSDPSLLEDSESSDLKEGKAKKRFVVTYERNAQARIDCIKEHGWDCSVCGFNFGNTYGSIGLCFIHVHHLKPISTDGAECVVKPKKDLRPVCPNCHAMLHSRNPPLKIEELKRIIEENS